MNTVLRYLHRQIFEIFFIPQNGFVTSLDGLISQKVLFTEIHLCSEAEIALKVSKFTGSP